MSSTNKTPNLNMHSWVPTDPVVRQDFNENFTKIDSAIGQMRASYGSCEIYTGDYTGTGALTMSLTFPKLPLYIIIGRYDWCDLWQGFIGHNRLIPISVSNSIYSKMTVSGNTVTWTRVGDSGIIFNDINKDYQYIAFTSALL